MAGRARRQSTSWSWSPGHVWFMEVMTKEQVGVAAVLPWVKSWGLPAASPGGSTKDRNNWGRGVQAGSTHGANARFTSTMRLFSTRLLTSPYPFTC